MKKFFILIALALLFIFTNHSAMALVNKSKTKKHIVKKHISKKRKKTVKKKNSKKTVKHKKAANTLLDHFSFTGRGYGHGVGLTQYGAEGMAEKGYGYKSILKYYYTGVDITSTDTTASSINVALKLNSPSVLIASDKTYSVNDRNTHAKLLDLPAGSSTIVQFQNGNFVVKNSQITNEAVTTESGIQLSGTNGELILPTTVSAIELTSNDNTLSYKGKAYFGSLELFRNNTRNNNIDVINNLNIELYLEGVIPSEIYPSWNSEAIKAQILAARTYALKQIDLNENKRFDVYDSVLSQVYNGASVSDQRINSLIDATRGEVITYKGELIDALFSASAGGNTVDASFVWGVDVPYLKGKPDPFDKSFYAKNWWKYTIKRSDMQKLFPSVGTIYNVKITGRKFLRPTAVTIQGSKRNIIIESYAFRDKLKYSNIISAIFSV